jgi:TRAP-type C4-dicarboxylate transport system permease small subunit
MLTRLCDTLLAACAALLILAMLGAVALGVVTRLVGEPLIWTDELARYLMVWTAFAGAMIAARRRAHIRIGLVLNLLPDAARRVAEALIQAGVAVFGALVAWYGADLVMRNLDIEATSMPITASLLYIPAVLFGLAIAAQALAQAWEALTTPGPAPVVEGGEIL